MQFPITFANLIIVGLGFSFAGPPVNLSMDLSGDFIQAPYNTVRNNETKTLFPTLEQGGGRGQSLKKTEISRGGRFGLDFTLPPFAPASGDIKDRLETILVNDLAIDETIYESTFSLRIPRESDPVRGWFAIHQWHQSSPESPAITMSLMKGHRSRVEVLVRHGPRKKGTRTKRLKRVDHTESFIDLPLDQWSDWKVLWRLSPKDPSKGLADVYLNGALVFQYRGLLGYSEVKNQSVAEKFGIYREKDPLGTHQIFYDSLAVKAMPKNFVPPVVPRVK